jgi:2-keto-4-pentenoate hydratase/2-oxohepta-3-ene-1,7-dioic acid hydratase in catechol pathway
MSALALVLADRIADIASRRLTTRLNGALMQSAALSEMIYPIEEIVAYVSAFTPLAPGDVILTGTPSGVGFKREPPRYLRPGDIVSVEIDGVGRLENPVRAEAEQC